MFISNTTGVAQTFIDGTLHLEATDFVQQDTNYGLYPTSLGFEQNGSGPNLIKINWGEVYADRTAQRVMFGNAATWETCTEYIYQRSTAWADDSISCVVSDDSNTLTGNWYLYVIGDENAAINSTGLAL